MKPRKIPDLTGKRFGLLTAIRVIRAGDPPRLLWECLCDCGKTVFREGWWLTRDSKSCGCLHHGPAKNRTHNQTDTPEYLVWRNMKTRCLNPNGNRYQSYGGRGITVCDRWINSFENFYADLGPRPSPAHSIDRIDNDQGYSPKNCRWAPRKEQMRNQQKSIMLTYRGETKNLADWVDQLGLKYPRTLVRHLAGYPPEVVLSNRPLARGRQSWRNGAKRT